MHVYAIRIDQVKWAVAGSCWHNDTHVPYTQMKSYVHPFHTMSGQQVLCCPLAHSPIVRKQVCLMCLCSTCRLHAGGDLPLWDSKLTAAQPCYTMWVIHANLKGKREKQHPATTSMNMYEQSVFFCLKICLACFLLLQELFLGGTWIGPKLSGHTNQQLRHYAHIHEAWWIFIVKVVCFG